MLFLLTALAQVYMARAGDLKSECKNVKCGQEGRVVSGYQ